MAGHSLNPPMGLAVDIIVKLAISTGVRILLVASLKLLMALLRSGLIKSIRCQWSLNGHAEILPIILTCGPSSVRKECLRWRIHKRIVF